jgi:hypothetical protein
MERHSPFPRSSGTAWTVAEKGLILSLTSGLGPIGSPERVSGFGGIRVKVIGFENNPG